MNDLELYNEYFFTYLEEWFDNYITQDSNGNWSDYGIDIIGEQFIVINTSGCTYSFVLSGYNNKDGAIFKLIFKE